MSNLPHLNLLILSNQTLYIDALKNLFFTEYNEIKTEGATLSNENISEVIKKEKPNIILLDANGMGKEIWEILQKFQRDFSAIKVIMLANSSEPIYLNYAKKYGATGYVLKTSPKELLIAAIKIVSNNGFFFDPGIMSNPSELANLQSKNKYKLSKREIEIIMLIKEGLTSKEISSHLGLSFHTIEAHRKNIYSKLKINKVAELIRIYGEFEK